MSKLKNPGSKVVADRELIATIEEQSAELRLLRQESRIGERNTRRESCATSRSLTLNARFSRSTPRSTRRRQTQPRSECPAFIHTLAEFTPLAIAVDFGRCGSLRGSAVRTT